MPSPTEKYCKLTTTKHSFSSKVDIEIDFGQESGHEKDEETVKTFTSVVDAFNYLATQGWELSSSYQTVNAFEVSHILRRKG
ncbi:hypothetical protein SAMN05428975_5867 [Mucilaginibacter sp. OK268]|uniref:hypothetical protein n=1 Tax=Mucilaginibacter sp. OK268 TaxID=1881048 RepID=UPI00088A61A9|nr:hypothetical protein [Mucilaginibacter sp. OK268]SDQ01546.1 hypothetical protein SAMN05428975_5867 [Mucilaginibacter sp. OK268]